MAMPALGTMLRRNQGGIAMSSTLGTIVTFLFTFGVLAVLAFALYHLYSSARDNSPRLRH